MKKNRVSVAILVAMAVGGIIQNASHAQGGVMMPEHRVAPAFHAVPTTNTVKREAATTQSATRSDKPMPVPSIRPSATGRVVHVQEFKPFVTTAPAVNVAPDVAPTSLRAPAPMGMGGFVPPAAK